MRKRSLICLLLLFIEVTAFTQALSDTTHITASAAWATRFYYAVLKSESPLYLGSDYAEYESVNDEHPFYLDNDWITGSVTYDGTVYHDVPLQLDIQSQKLITEHLSSRKKIQLVPAKITSFDIAGHHFVHLNREALDGFNERPGYYDLLADGGVKLFALRVKEFEEVVVSGKFEPRFNESTKYFILKDNKFHSVNGRASAIHVLSDKKTMLVQSLKKRRVRFKKDRETALIETVNLYNNLKD